jgi:glycerol kinase
VIVAIDLGTTRIKGGVLGDDGALAPVIASPAPPLAGAGPVRESDPVAYEQAASGLLDELLAAVDRATVRVGIASQRGSFCLWERESGVPVTPLISWQDHRSEGWCDRHRDREAEIRDTTGLLLSPHYAATKLATLVEADRTLGRRLADGSLLFGTLETYLLWQWSGGRSHHTDLTMAARTLLCDPASACWAPSLLDLFCVPVACLPAIGDSGGLAIPLIGGGMVTATLGDQASAALAVVGDDPDAVLVNLGTGGFVLRPTGAAMQRRPGYLAGPLLAEGGRTRTFALEGTVNGAGPAVDRYGPGPTDLPEVDPAPDAFALPDLAGVGAPHWRPDIAHRLSPAAAALDAAGRRRVALEGVLFRVQEIVADLGADAPPHRILLTGGLARDPAAAEALAGCLGRTIKVVDEAEASLLGAARLAAGITAPPRLATHTVHPGPAVAYLRPKYLRWRAWLSTVLGG